MKLAKPTNRLLIRYAPARAPDEGCQKAAFPWRGADHFQKNSFGKTDCSGATPLRAPYQVAFCIDDWFHLKRKSPDEMYEAELRMIERISAETDMSNPESIGASKYQILICHQRLGEIALVQAQTEKTLEQKAWLLMVAHRHFVHTSAKEACVAMKSLCSTLIELSKSDPIWLQPEIVDAVFFTLRGFTRNPIRDEMIGDAGFLSVIDMSLELLNALLYHPSFERVSSSLYCLAADPSVKSEHADYLIQGLQDIFKAGLAAYENFKSVRKQEASALHAQGRPYDHLMEEVLGQKYRVLTAFHISEALRPTAETKKTTDGKVIDNTDLVEMDFEDFRVKNTTLRRLRWALIARCPRIIEKGDIDEAISLYKKSIERLELLHSAWDRATPQQRNELQRDLFYLNEQDKALLCDTLATAKLRLSQVVGMTNSLQKTKVLSRMSPNPHEVN